jgi:type I restriction enzyme R subunit
MKGRGARTIEPADLKAVTDDADAKTRFVIVDAIGVTEHDFVEPPLNREKSISLKKLLDKAAALTLTEDEVATLASRLAALDRQLTSAERNELDEVAGLHDAQASMHDIVRALVDAVDPRPRPPPLPRKPIAPPPTWCKTFLTRRRRTARRQPRAAHQDHRAAARRIR